MRDEHEGELEVLAAALQELSPEDRVRLAAMLEVGNSHGDKGGVSEGCQP